MELFIFFIALVNAEELVDDYEDDTFKTHHDENLYTIQKALIGHGYNCGKAKADGVFGSGTASCIKQFQKNNGLRADGIIGKKTVAKLNKAYHIGIPSTYYAKQTVGLNQNNTNNNQKKSNKEYLYSIQKALIGHGYNCGKYKADGVFGSGTASCVKQFQKNNGLKNDGVIGTKTVAKLNELYNLRLPSTFYAKQNAGKTNITPNKPNKPIVPDDPNVEKPNTSGSTTKINVNVKNIPGKFGIDIGVPLSQKTLQCVRNNGYTDYFITRAWRSIGAFDKNCPAIINSAKQAGFKDNQIESYFFPKVRNGNAAQQVTAFWNEVTRRGLKFRIIWFDVEKNWFGKANKYGNPTTENKMKNRAFFEQMMNKVRALGIPAGIYTSINNWQEMFGLDYKYPYASSTPLWYCRYNKYANFKDFKPFGGWSAPYMKQFRGDVKACNAVLDFNYRP